jgi:hypothetical protein
MTTLKCCKGSVLYTNGATTDKKSCDCAVIHGWIIQNPVFKTLFTVSNYWTNVALAQTKGIFRGIKRRSW